MKNLYLTLLMIAIFSVANVYSNNLRIESVERGTTNKDEITFSISWDNSWYVGGTPSNHDAAWVFIKFKECGTDLWHHALLSTTASEHSLGTVYDFAKNIETTDRYGAGTDNNNGAMIRRTDFGTGDVSGAITLKITGSTSGITFDNAKDYEVRVFGTEMVQVKEGNFGLGDGRKIDGTGSSDRLGFRNTANSNRVEVYTVNTENAISTGDAIPLWDAAQSSTINIAADYPKGFAEFYCMKYEITQGQYADFMNIIGQLNSNRNPGMYNTNRFAIRINADGEFAADDPNRACNYIDYDDVMAFLDWAALRPMSEMEYEKVCRGFMAPTSKEYAWGNTNLYEVREVSTPEDGTDTAKAYSSNPYANCNTHTQQWSNQSQEYTINGDVNQNGPIGVGIFARDNTQNREATGATYWGIMEMSGNVGELTVPITHTYKGTWGDGILDSSTGNHNQADWTVNPNSRVDGMYRGVQNRNPSNGGDFGINSMLWVSARSDQLVGSYGDYYAPISNTRDWRAGGRGVR